VNRVTERMPARSFSMKVWLLAAVAAVCPSQAFADCTSGSPPSYADIRYVQVREFSLASGRPGFEVEGFVVPWRAQMSLKGCRDVPLEGTYDAKNPRRVFATLVAILARNDFFEMQLPVLAKCCGVGTIVGTSPSANGIFGDDPQTRAFLRLEDEIRQKIFSQEWTLRDGS
jgi:hypothetical protein